MNTATAEQFLSPEMRIRKDLDVRPGDVVRVHLKITEKGKTRIQIFEGLVLARKHGRENGGTITVRKVSNGVGVERVFPLYSPMIDMIEVVKRSRVRQAKLYYLRDKVAREVRRKMRNFVSFFASSADLVIPAEDMVDETPEEQPETNEETNIQSPQDDTTDDTTASPDQEENTDSENDDIETKSSDE